MSAEFTATFDDGDALTATFDDAVGTTAVFGEILGDVEDQENLQAALDAKAALNHTHDARYYTETEMDALLAEKADADDIPTKTSDLTNDSGFLTAHQSLADYRTSAAQDIIDAGKQATISDLATIRSNAATGAGLESAVTANTAARHSHDNKSVLDGITASLISAWNSAEQWISTNGSSLVAHISDAVKHITSGERTAWNAKYDKPATGIPSSDLSTAVQTSLGKADSAIQAHQSLAAYRTSAAQDAIDATKQDTISDLSTIRSGAAAGATALQAVPSTYRTSAAQDVIDAAQNDTIAAKSAVSVAASGTATDEVKYITVNGTEKKLAGGYEKPSTGIPKTDLASDVQTSLGKADTALQSHQSLSAYRTSADQDEIDEGKQDVISDLATIRSNASTGAGLASDVAANTTARHTHSNKALLDTYTQTEANIADAVSKKHSHSTAQTNAMDSGITAAKVTAYDATQNMISDAWSSSYAPYDVGSYAIYDNKLWRCLVANSVAPSEGSNWTEVSIADEVSAYSDYNESVSNDYGSGQLRIVKVGRTCHVTFKFVTTAATTASTTFATIPSAYISGNETKCIYAYIDKNGTLLLNNTDCFIRTDGRIQQSLTASVPSDSTILLEFVYKL